MPVSNLSEFGITTVLKMDVVVIGLGKPEVK